MIGSRQHACAETRNVGGPSCACENVQRKRRDPTPSRRPAACSLSTCHGTSHWCDSCVVVPSHIWPSTFRAAPSVRVARRSQMAGLASLGALSQCGDLPDTNARVCKLCRRDSSATEFANDPGHESSICIACSLAHSRKFSDFRLSQLYKKCDEDPGALDAKAKTEVINTNKHMKHPKTRGHII